MLPADCQPVRAGESRAAQAARAPSQPPPSGRGPCGAPAGAGEGGKYAGAARARRGGGGKRSAAAGTGRRRRRAAEYTKATQSSHQAGRAEAAVALVAMQQRGRASDTAALQAPARTGLAPMRCSRRPGPPARGQSRQRPMPERRVARCCRRAAWPNRSRVTRRRSSNTSQASPPCAASQRKFKPRRCLRRRAFLTTFIHSIPRPAGRQPDRDGATQALKRSGAGRPRGRQQALARSRARHTAGPCARNGSSRTARRGAGLV
jgi:hypothetical protein